MIERDAHLPPLADLLAEAGKAQTMIARSAANALAA